MYEMNSQAAKDRTKKAAAPAANSTGIPMQMKNRFEKASGFSFEDVRVHYNSREPARLQALAYTKGSEVYIGPRQERHLKHELGHVVQQKQGIVKPTGFINGEKLNDEAGLERAADAWNGV